MANSVKETARDGYRITWVGVLVNCALILIKLAAGVWGHSQALIADAIHSLSDLLTDFVALVGLWVGRKEPDARHHYGHGRLETLASFLVGLGLMGAAFLLGYEAVQTLLKGSPPQPAWVAALAALLSILAKEALYRFTIRVGRRLHSPVLLANA